MQGHCRDADVQERSSPSSVKLSGMVGGGPVDAPFAMVALGVDF